VAVQRELGVPVKLVGLGEGPDDLAPFEPEAFVDALVGEEHPTGASRVRRAGRCARCAESWQNLGRSGVRGPERS